MPPRKKSGRPIAKELRRRSSNVSKKRCPGRENPMKRNWVQYSVIGIIVLTALTVPGCAAVGLFSKDQTHGGREIWEIETPPGDILSAIAETGKSMGLGVDYWELKNPPPGLEYWERKSPPPVDKNDTRSSWIMLSADELADLRGLFIGKSSVSGLSFEAREGGRRLEVSVIVVGKFGSGRQEAATKLLKDFRTNLSNRIGKIVVIQNTLGS
jgi:hypothetical protein